MIEFKRETLSYSDNPKKIFEDYIGFLKESEGKALSSENRALLSGDINKAIAKAGEVSGIRDALRKLEAMLVSEGIAEATSERDR